MQRILIKKCFQPMVGSVCCTKWFTAGSRNVANISLMTKRLTWRCGSGRQQSKDFHAASFDALG
jgi:hypothetical protein